MYVLLVAGRWDPSILMYYQAGRVDGGMKTDGSPYSHETRLEKTKVSVDSQ